MLPAWTLAPDTPQRRALDALPLDAILKAPLRSGHKIKPQYVPAFTAALVAALAGLRLAVEEGSAATPAGAEAQHAATAMAWAKLFHLLPTLLLIPDGSITRAARFAFFSAGDLAALIAPALATARGQAQAAADRRQRDGASAAAAAAHGDRVVAAARKPGGMRRAARMLSEGADSSSPRTEATLAKLQQKHPQGDNAALRAASAAAAAEAAHNMAQSSAPAPFTISADQLRAAIAGAKPGSSGGPSALSNLHLQQCVTFGHHDAVTHLLELCAWLGTTIYSAPASLPAEFWALHSSARLSAVGEKARPIACGDTLRRLFGHVFCEENKDRILELLEPVGQFGVGARGGAEVVALAAQLVYEAGGVLLAIDGTNAFNSLSRAAVLRAVANLTPDLYPYVEHLYGPASVPFLQFSLDGEQEARVVLSQEGVQQGCPLGPLLFALAVRGLMVSFRAKFPSLALPAYLDDMTIMSLRADVGGMRLVSAGFAHVADGLREVGVQVNTTKSLALLPPVSEDGTREAELAALPQSVPARVDGCKLMGVPIGTDAFVTAALAQALQDESTDRLLHGAAQLRDAHVAYSVLRMCGPSRATFLSRNVGPAVALPALRRFDAAVLSTFAAVIQEPVLEAADVSAAGGGGGAAPGGAAAPRTALHAAMEAIRAPAWNGAAPVALSPNQQLHTRMRQSNGGLGLTSVAANAHAAFLGRTVERLEGALRAFPPGLGGVLLGGEDPLLLTTATFRHLAAAVAAMRACGPTTAAALRDLIHPAWSGPWFGSAEAPAAERAAARKLLMEQLTPPAAAAGPRAGAAAGAPAAAQAPTAGAAPRSRARGGGAGPRCGSCGSRGKGRPCTSPQAAAGSAGEACGHGGCRGAAAGPGGGGVGPEQRRASGRVGGAGGVAQCRGQGRHGMVRRAARPSHRPPHGV
jgi:hypothetical protein